MLKRNHTEDQNFWISYADLMAGLLFVFILVVGAIVVKSELIQSDLQTIRADLEKEKEALHMSEESLSQKKKKLSKIQEELLSARAENTHLSLQISLLESQTAKLNDTIVLLSADISQKAESLALSETEMQSLKALLLENENNIETLTYSNQSLMSDLNNSKAEIQQLQSFVTDYNRRHTLDSNMIQLRDDEIVQLEKALLIKKRAYQQVVEDLNITRTKIKNLTGIKIKVVQRLKEKMGDSINIDPKSGALRFSSNILFNQGEAILKAEAKKELSRILGTYIDTLLSDEEMRQYVDTITIEGHTNSDGSYLYNLNLSQQRALAVMSFLYEEYPKNRKLFEKYLNASGRSFSEPILKDSIEDKDASRRIEIKFRIKNEEAVKELMNYLNKEELNNAKQ
jgi:chemotaxis protein MotB